MRRPFFVALAFVLCSLLAGACSPDQATTPGQAVDPTPAPSQAPGPASNIEVSDEVPTLEELKELGLGEPAAECFIATIDPNNTGRVESAELFMQAWVACL